MQLLCSSTRKLGILVNSCEINQETQLPSGDLVEVFKFRVENEAVLNVLIITDVPKLIIDTLCQKVTKNLYPLVQVNDMQVRPRIFLNKSSVSHA